MATKTQEYLKALAGQRALPDDVCCTTLTQDLIIDATERVNTLQEELDSIKDFVGTDGQTEGKHGLVPAPAASDADKYLKSDGTWATVSAGPTVVQTTGQSTTDVMSQKAVTDIIGNVETLLHTLNSGNGV